MKKNPVQVDYIINNQLILFRALLIPALFFIIGMFLLIGIGKWDFSGMNYLVVFFGGIFFISFIKTKTHCCINKIRFIPGYSIKLKF